MRIKILASVAAILAFGPMAANADLIQYEVSGDSDSGWTLSGALVLEESDAIAGVNLIDDLVSWAFSWTNGIDAFSVTSLDSFLAVGPIFEIDATGEIVDITLCTNSCGLAHISHAVDIEGWNATISPAGDFVSDEFSSAQWSGPSFVSVPEPGTLTLFALGLLGLGISRRKAA